MSIAEFGRSVDLRQRASDVITITAFVAFNFIPRTFGGGVRIANVYQGLSEHFNVNLVGVRGYDGRDIERFDISQTLTAYLVSMSTAYYDLLVSEQKKAGGPLHDILLIDNYELITQLTSLCRRLNSSTDIFVSSQPYFFNMFGKYCAGKSLLYEAHDVDYELKQSYFPRENPYANRYLDVVKNAERAACRDAALIATASGEDAQKLCELYSVDPDKVVLLPNGIDVSSYGCRNSRIWTKNAVFVGSAHGPNIEAVSFIIRELAPKSPGISYTIVGNLREVFADQELPHNVRFVGMVDDADKEAIYASSAVALNPMFSGSGTNLKVCEYAVIGIPIVSTPFGMRGLDHLAQQVWMAEPPWFLKTIEDVMALPDAEVNERTFAARAACEDHFDKSKVVLGLVDRISGDQSLRAISKGRKRIAVEGRILHRNVTGSERYITEILKNLLLMEGREAYEIGLVNDGGYRALEVDFYVPFIGANPPVDLYHRTYQPSTHFEIMELLLARRSVFTFLDLILCKHPEYFANRLDHEKFVLYMRLALECSDRIIAISESSKVDVVSTFGIDEERVDVVYLGLDSEKFRKLDEAEVERFKKEFSLPSKYVLYLGTDYPHKNLAKLFEAFAQVASTRELRDYALVIAGNQVYQGGQECFPKHLGSIRDRVVFLGHFPDDKIAHLYSGADVFVYPSLYEGFGLPVLEAFACEVPLVCSKSTSLPEVAGDAAYLVDATQSDEIAKGIVEVVTNRDLRQCLIARGRARVREFTWERCATNTYEVYRRALEEPSYCTARSNEIVMALLGDIMERNFGHLRSQSGASVPSSTIQRSIPQGVFSPSFVAARVRQVRNIQDLKRLLVSAAARLSAGRRNA